MNSLLRERSAACASLLAGDLLPLRLQHLALRRDIRPPRVEFLLTRFEVAGDLVSCRLRAVPCCSRWTSSSNSALLGGDGGGLDSQSFALLFVADDVGGGNLVVGRRRAQDP